MKRIGTFDLVLNDNQLSSLRSFKKKRIPVEILVDRENTLVILDCACCRDLLASKLPAGVLIPIVSTLKSFFEERGMRNIEVRVSGDTMRRTYNGQVDESIVTPLKNALQDAVTQFIKRKPQR